MSQQVPSKTFRPRAFVALGLVFSGLGLPVTGIANHLQQFESMTVARHAWMSAHNCLGLLFVIFSVWHLLLNRRALGQHLRGWASHLPTLSREAILAAFVVAGVLTLFVGHAFHVPG